MDNLKLTYIQSDLYWEDIDANLAMFEEKIWQIEQKVDIIVLPEMFSTGFSMQAKKLAEPMNSKTCRWMKQQASQTSALVIGSVIIQEKGNFYNRLIAMKPDGDFYVYDKKHLFTLAQEEKHYAPGSSRLVFEYKGWNICGLVCYDLRFPVWARNKYAHENPYEYDLLIYVANWPAPRIHAWDVLLQARAIENQAFCVGVNRIGKDGNNMPHLGHSGVYDFKGGALSGPNENASIATVTLEKAPLEEFRSRFPFQLDSDTFQIS